MNRTARFAATFALLAAGLFIGAVVAELGLRVYAAGDSTFAAELRQYDLLEAKILPMGEYGYQQRANSAFHYGNGTVATSNALGYRGPVVPIAKPAGTIRIVLVGGSTTHGWGVNDNETLDTYMRRDLAKRFPDRHFEVVNLAFDGYDSYQDYERIKTEGLRLDPDVIIVNAGINDVRNARFPNLADPDPRTLLFRTTVEQLRAQDARGHASVKTWLKHHFYVARFASMVHESWLRRGKGGRAATARATPHYGALDYFELNLRRIAEIAKTRKIALLFSNPPSAIPTNFAPDSVSPRSYWIVDAAVTQQVRDSLDARTRALAAQLHSQGQRVAYVAHHVAPTMFLDDAHLTAAGNQCEAAEFDSAVASILGLEGKPR